MNEVYEYKVIPRSVVSKNIWYKEKAEQASEVAKWLEEWLNSHGNEGWQLVGPGERCFVFMREKRKVSS